MCSVFSRRESAYVRIISNGVIAWVQRLEIPGPAVNNSRLPSSKTHQQKVVIVIESLGVMVLHKVSNISARLAPRLSPMHGQRSSVKHVQSYFKSVN